MKKHITFALLFAAALTAQAQQGGISGEMLNQIKQSYKATPANLSRERYIIIRSYHYYDRSDCSAFFFILYPSIAIVILIKGLIMLKNA